VEDKETVVPLELVADGDAKSLSESAEGGADNDTNTDQVKGTPGGIAHEAETPTEPNASPEERTLREIFDPDKAAALDWAEQLCEMIPHIELDGLFGDDVATDDNRPMPTLVLAKELCAALENIECLKLLMEKEQYI
jgi:hypothetical protein